MRIAPSPFGTISMVCAPFDRPLANVTIRIVERSDPVEAVIVSVNSGMASPGYFESFGQGFFE